MSGCLRYIVQPKHFRKKVVMWSPVITMSVPANPTGVTIARVSGTSRAITVLINNVGSSAVVVGPPPTIALGVKQCVAWTITSGDLVLHNSGPSPSDVQI